MEFNVHRKVCDGEYDGEAVEQYTEELFALFVSSPEAAALDEQEDDFDGFYWSHAMIGYGIDHCGVTPADMAAGDFRQILFSIIPRKVMCEPDQAGEIVDELGAFWQFAQRQFGLANAAECLAVLDEGATGELERQLADPSRFGMAKSFFAEGKNAGFDVDTEEGLQAWVRASNAAQGGPGGGSPLGGTQVLPIVSTDAGDRPAAGGGSAPAARQKPRETKRKKRQMQKASRRRNRGKR